MNAKLLVLVPAVVLAATLLSPGCSSNSAEPVVKKVDHITISTNQAQELFTIFNDTLGLPVAWPFSAYPGFSTGGVQAGNVNLETMGMGDPVAGEEGAASLYGIVLEPYPIDQVMDPLRARGADPSDPQVQMREINGQQVPFWTNVTLNTLCTPAYIVYLCEYSNAAKSALQAIEVSGPLGGLGLVSVSEIRIGSKDAGALRQKWSDAFAPSSMSAEGLMPIGEGPAVAVASSDQDAIQSLVFEVASLKQAREFLQAQGMLGDSSDNELRIDPTKIQGLDIRVIQR